MMGLRNLGDLMWRRHRNPWSGWSRVLVGMAMGIALWFHHWPALALTLLAAITNPFWFAEPKSDSAWMTRVVDGERLWLSQADWLDKAVMFGPSTIMSVLLIGALYLRDPLWSTVFGVTVIGHKFLFLFYCVRFLKQHQDNQSA